MGTPTPPNTVLLIADISGFTRFMRLHALSTSHARQIVVRLLKALVAASQPPLKVAELEGDAVFFYAQATGQDLAQVARKVKTQMLMFFRVFRDEIQALSQIQACVCDACTSVGGLRLKQVVHTGDVSVERIDRFEKLFGLDVIVVHRLLKNSVPASEYVMLTDTAWEAFEGFYALEPERRVEAYEGVGELETLVLYDQDLAPVLAQQPAALQATTRIDTLGWKLKMHGRTILELLTGRKPGALAASA